jgi:hypothetical protein
MTTRFFIILLMFGLTSCFWNAYPDDKYSFDKNLRALVNCYKVGDTLVFKNSVDSIETFVITNIDSTTNNKKGFFINARNFKSITVFYKQFPVDKWQRHWTEMGANNSEKKELSEDGTLITIEKFPDTGTGDYYFNFKEFRCSNSEIPKLYTDTIILDKLSLTDYFKIDNCYIYSDIPNSIQVCYITVDKGLVAFNTKNGELWTRQN